MNRQTEQKEKEYFIHNKTKIIITEHFNEKGKAFIDVVQNAIERNGGELGNALENKKIS